jgi:hypothetical protein
MPAAQKAQSLRQRLLGRIPPGTAVVAGLSVAVGVMFAAGVLLPSSGEALTACKASCAPRAGRLVSTLPEAMVAQGKQAPKKCECM